MSDSNNHYPSPRVPYKGKTFNKEAVDKKIQDLAKRREELNASIDVTDKDDVPTLAKLRVSLASTISQITEATQSLIAHGFKPTTSSK